MQPPSRRPPARPPARRPARPPELEVRRCVVPSGSCEIPGAAGRAAAAPARRRAAGAGRPHATATAQRTAHSEQNIGAQAHRRTGAQAHRRTGAQAHTEPRFVSSQPIGSRSRQNHITNYHSSLNERHLSSWLLSTSLVALASSSSLQ